MKKASMLFVRNNLKWLMGEKISPYALASETGVPQPTIFRILTGESDDPRTKTLQPLAKYFGVSVADLRDRDLTAIQNEYIQPEDAKVAPENKPILDARQHEWLGLLHHLGSDDIAEFSAMIRSRQERNVRLIEELENSLHPRKSKESSRNFLDENSHGKKQRSQSS